MSELFVKKIPSPEDRDLPIFEELNEVADQIRVRAYSLFADRGFSEGHELDDWLTAQREICWPVAELIEEDDEFRARVALAGFEAEDIDVTATPREIIVKASRDAESQDDETDDESKIRWSEFRSSSVYRQIAFPAEVDVSAIRVKLENGMLEIEAPKARASEAAEEAQETEQTDDTEETSITL